MRQHPSRGAPTTGPVLAPSSVLRRAFHEPVSRDRLMLAPSLARLPPPSPARMSCTGLRPGFPTTLASRTPSLPTSEVPRSAYRLRQVVLQPALQRGLDRSDMWRHAGRRRRTAADYTPPRPLRPHRVPLSFLWRDRVQCMTNRLGRRVVGLSRAAACSGSGRRTRRRYATGLVLALSGDPNGLLTATRALRPARRHTTTGTTPALRTTMP